MTRERLAPDAAGTFTAQWNDDVHHGLHVALTGEGDGYYADYRADPSLLPRALAEGFAFQGETMSYRDAPRGTPSAHLPPTAFVAFLQNHDQIGNRAFGDRITTLAPPEAVRAAAAIYLLAPQVPMLSWGRNGAASSPSPSSAASRGSRDAVREGRRAEFARFPAFADLEARARIPDPVSRRPSSPPSWWGRAGHPGEGGVAGLVSSRPARPPHPHLAADGTHYRRPLGDDGAAGLHGGME